jgi:hypothetical protein
MLFKTSLVHFDLAVVNFELGQIAEFYAQAERRFGEQIDSLLQEAKTLPASASEQVTDKYESLCDLSRLNRYFGVVMAYAVLERFLLNLVSSARIEVYCDPKLHNERYTMKQYTDFFLKLGIDITKAPFEYDKLMELSCKRNYIVHSGGWLPPKKDGDSLQMGKEIDVPEEYVQQCVGLVGQTCELISERYQAIVGRLAGASERTH